VFGDGLNRWAIADVLLDLHDYYDLKNKKLIEYIDRVGFVIFITYMKSGN